MTYFAKELQRLNKELHSKEYLLRQIIRSKQFIDKHFAETISIDDMAEEASFSRFHFQRLFKKKYGVTPNQYLQQVRIDRAKRLLKKGVTASQVCHEVGFESIPTFSKLFKRITGSSPSVFLKKALLNK